MDLRFTKMHGIGNDFIVIDDIEGGWDFEEEAVRWICDRHFGIGADGLIMVRAATDGVSDYFMLYINADGTTAEMCGNGVRCFTKWLVDRGLVTKDTVTVQTLGGSREIGITRNGDGTMAEARVDMGEPVFEPARVPVELEGPAVVDRVIETEAGPVSVSAVSMGNPHAIVWVDDVETAPVDVIGPLVETHEAFPARTNVEFLQVTDTPDVLRLRVWERGVGETYACGTGACAAVAVAVNAGRCGRVATVELPGGDLRIEWADDGHIYMTGDADEVFEGVLTLSDDD
jgi:diaminopimelate epimerase